MAHIYEELGVRLLINVAPSRQRSVRPESRGAL
jgi:hypothetical protein